MNLRKIKIKKVLGYKRLDTNPLEPITNLFEINRETRRHLFKKDLLLWIITDKGTFIIEVKAGFVFDGRSGGKFLDWYVPNLGTEEEIILWLFHDLLAYATLVNFWSCNHLLYRFAYDIVKYLWIKCAAIERAVTIANKFDPWFGMPKPGEWEYENLGKFTIIFEDKK
jgi:hypothetical protein